MQIAVVEWCRAQRHTMPEVAEVWHMPNYRRLKGTARQRIAAVKHLRKLGFADGYPDLGWDFARGPWHGLRIELKMPGEGPSPAQVERIALLNSRGYYALVCSSQEDVQRVVTAYWKTE